MKAEVTVESGVYTTQSNLLCPSCNEPYLHQGAIEVYDRAEDAEQVRCTVVEDGNIFSQIISNATSNNPSSRRHGMLIHFECEHCTDVDFKLNIAQHKGFTLMDWEYEHGSNSGSES